VRVYAQHDVVVIEIISGVKVLKEGGAQDVDVLVFTAKFTLGENEVAFAIVHLVEVGFWRQHEGCSTQNNSDGRHLCLDVLAG